MSKKKETSDQEKTAKILEFNGKTLLDTECSQVIGALNQEEFERILIIGFTTDGELYVASHTSDIGAQLLLMERAKYFLLHDADTV